MKDNRYEILKDYAFLDRNLISYIAISSQQSAISKKNENLRSEH